MKKLVSTLALTILTTAQAQQINFQVQNQSNLKVIYGEDDRMEVYQADETIQKLAASTAAMIPANEIKFNADSGKYETKKDTLAQSMGVCEDQRFASQMASAYCSGFLVGPDLLVTAGHCAKNALACATNKWVFDYKVDGETKKASSEHNKDNVYSCKKVISAEFQYFGDNDYAIIQLDRVVKGREVLKVRTESDIEVGTELFVIGHPSGLPAKVAGGATVRKSLADEFFQANLDTFGGNSGSAVFNAETNEVEGILVRGETDYVFDFQKGCQVVNECADESCRGEDVTRLHMIKELVYKDKIHEAIIDGDDQAVADILVEKYNPDMHNDKLKTALMTAYEVKNLNALRMLIGAGADVTISNSKQKAVLDQALLASDFDMVAELALSENLDLRKLQVNELSLIDTALVSGNKKLLNAIIDRKADLNASTIASVAMLAQNAELLKLAMDNGLDIQKNPSKLVATAQTSAIVNLVKAGIDVNTQIYGSNTILAQAIKRGDNELATPMIELGADTSKKIDNNRLLLNAAIEADMNQTAKALINAGADIDAIESMSKNNALHAAVTNNNLEMVKILVKTTKNLKAKNSKGQTAKKIAKLNKNKTIKKIVAKEMRSRFFGNLLSKVTKR